MKLQEFIPDAGNSISLQHNLPNHLCWGTSEKSMKRGKFGDNTYAAGGWFDRLPIRVQDRVQEAGFGRFVDTLPRSIIFDDQLWTLDQLGLWASLRVAIVMEPTISDKRFRYESIISHYEEMLRARVEEMDVDIVTRAFRFYLLSTTFFTNHGNDANLELLPPLQDLDATRQFN
ncbi:hypothetical protein JCGZ_20214 [Jatropha curcas]|uniref:Uncharacterized protein n=1 Tax=Jatropha curcas TaxID=180498 RepID=A0A067K552_JATCU|nr:hypothetical protein JCGZ_20214 [Jatropha curcas]